MPGGGWPDVSVDLPEITQEFSAQTRTFSGIQLAIDAAERFRDMNLEPLSRPGHR